ncbi:MAG TPA: DUF1579 family protein [Steroidobacteraceae bacterium]
MNRCYGLLKYVLCAGLLLSAAASRAQSQPADAAPARSGAAEAMVLGPQQAALGALLGSWDVDIVLADGSKPAQHSKGKAEYSWVITGRWLGCHLTGEMLGFPYEEFTIVGYDSYAKNIVEVAVESLDNSMLLSRGPTSGANQAVTALYGELDEYSAGVLHSPYKVVLKQVNRDRHVTTILGFDDSGNEVKKVEFTFSRKSAAR